MHRISIIAFDHVVPSDLSVPVDIFPRVEAEGVAKPYEVTVCATKRKVRAGLIDFVVPHGLDVLRNADTIIVPGISSLDQMPPAPILTALRRAAERGARIASICSGSMILAEAGLLDGLTATSHWQAVPELSRRYPRVKFDSSPLYIDNGRILTSAGASAGLDLCLYMIRQDYGATAAAHSARLAVVSLERTGNQAQFVVNTPHETTSNFGSVLEWMEKNSSKNISLDEMAGKAGMSTRTFRRRFMQLTGQPPQRWLRRIRLYRAQQMLEETDLTVEAISEKSGLGSTTMMREHFWQEFRTTPTSYRQSFAVR
jgi:transcriptional regulator GlxA family with amidase domain